MASGAELGSLVPPKPNATQFTPIETHQDNPRVELCAHVDTHYDPTAIALCSAFIMCGILFTFVGYRCFKTIMFLTGFIFASSLVYLICMQGELMSPYGNIGVAALAGLLFGLITMLVQYVGLFMSGLHTGFLLGLAGLLTADHFMETSPKGSVWLCVGVLLGTALLIAIFNLYFKKGLTILGTSVYGGALLMASMDYFVEKISMLSWLWQRVSLRPVEPPPCWFSWIVLSAWPSFALVGFILQCGLTGRGVHHEDELTSRKKMRGSSTRSSARADRAEMRQKKYRYLYQVRTAHGDVISQNFVQALQKKESESTNGGECSTLQSDATNLTILPDAQLAVLTESEDDSQVEITMPRR